MPFLTGCFLAIVYSEPGGQLRDISASLSQDPHWEGRSAPPPPQGLCWGTGEHVGSSHVMGLSQPRPRTALGPSLLGSCCPCPHSCIRLHVLVSLPRLPGAGVSAMPTHYLLQAHGPATVEPLLTSLCPSFSISGCQWPVCSCQHRSLCGDSLWPSAACSLPSLRGRSEVPGNRPPGSSPQPISTASGI